MSISYEARQIGKVTILDVSRPIDVGVPLAFGPGSSVSLQELVCDFVQRGHVNIVLNLQNVVYIDSTGIAELVGSVTTLRKQGGDLISSVYRPC